MEQNLRLRLRLPASLSVRAELNFATKLERVVDSDVTVCSCSAMIGRFLARGALIGARRCSSAKRRARAAFTSLADSDPPGPPARQGCYGLPSLACPGQLDSESWSIEDSLSPNTLTAAAEDRS